jgi:putative transposase
VKYAWISGELPAHSLVMMCRVLGVSRSGYYAWRGRRPSRRMQENARLVEAIHSLHIEFREAYGTERMWPELNARGFACGRHRVGRLRRQHGVLTRRRRRFQRATQQERQPPSPNLLGRPLAALKPDQVWGSDVTQIRTRRGWLYLAVVLDLCTRRVVGWAMADRMFQELSLAALRMATLHRPRVEGRIHHSDQGAIYASATYREQLARAGMVSSMSRAGVPYDNAMVESFFSSLKNELTHHVVFSDQSQGEAALFEYIEVFYNRMRRHQALGSRSPVQFEAEAVA